MHGQDSVLGGALDHAIGGPGKRTEPGSAKPKAERPNGTAHARSGDNVRHRIPGRAPDLARRTDLTNRRVLLMVRDEIAAARYQHLFKLFGAM